MSVAPIQCHVTKWVFQKDDFLHWEQTQTKYRTVAGWSLSQIMVAVFSLNTIVNWCYDSIIDSFHERVAN